MTRTQPLPVEARISSPVTWELDLDRSFDLNFSQEDNAFLADWLPQLLDEASQPPEVSAGSFEVSLPAEHLSGATISSKAALPEPLSTTDPVRYRVQPTGPP